MPFEYLSDLQFCALASDAARLDCLGDHGCAATAYLELSDRFQLHDLPRFAETACERAVSCLIKARLDVKAAGASAKLGRIRSQLCEYTSCREALTLAEALFLKAGDYRQAAFCMRAAAEASLKESAVQNAGTMFANASRVMAEHHSQELEFIAACDLAAAMAFARGRHVKSCTDAYSRFKQIYDSLEVEAKRHFRVDELISECSQAGLNKIASVVYVDQMNRLCTESPTAIGRVLLRLWGLTSLYGESWGHFCVSMVCVVVLYALLYCPSPTGSGFLIFEGYGNFRTPPYQDGNETANCGLALEQSVSIFTNMGPVDIRPANLAAWVVVRSEYLMGIVAIASLATLLYNRLFRR